MVVAFVFFLLVTQLVAQGRDARRVAVTSVAGESWLMHLGRSFDDTSMGKTERLGPPPAENAPPAPQEEPDYAHAG